MHKNSDCHLFSNAQKVIYGKIRKALGRNVEKDRNEGRTGCEVIVCVLVTSDLISILTRRR